MSENVINSIIKLWATINPVAGYTNGYTKELTGLLFETKDTLKDLKNRILSLENRLDSISEIDLRETARAVLVNQKTQLDLARPSGAGPSGTGAGGVYAAADGVFYIVLKKDYSRSWVAPYLVQMVKMVEFETQRWCNGSYTAEEKKDCLNTVIYVQGVLKALEQANRNLSGPIDDVRNSLKAYQAIFYDKDLVSADFQVLWKSLRQGDAVQGPVKAKGYPEVLQDYYTLNMSADQVEQAATDWLLIEMPVTIDLAQRIGATLGLKPDADLQTVWDASHKYAVDFTISRMQEVLEACNNYGQDRIIGFTAEGIVKFDPTPDYLVNLVTGGEDFAIDYLTDSPFSQLYLTASKNTSLLTMINILVHEASHGFNFVMSARCVSSPLLNLNTSLEVPMTEGQAYFREFLYYAGATDLLNKADLSVNEKKYLNLYGETEEEQRAAIMGARLETCIWRIIRYIRALSDTRVNGGKQTYTDFITWVAEATV